MTDDLTTWLRAQLDDDEASLRTWLGNLPADSGAADWVRQWLAEVDAKRRILDDIIPLIDGMDAQIEAEFGTGGSHPAESEQLLRLLALPYADRPGYREVRTS